MTSLVCLEYKFRKWSHPDEGILFRLDQAWGDSEIKEAKNQADRQREQQQNLTNLWVDVYDRQNDEQIPLDDQTNQNQGLASEFMRFKTSLMANESNPAEISEVFTQDQDIQFCLLGDYKFTHDDKSVRLQKIMDILVLKFRSLSPRIDLFYLGPDRGVYHLEHKDNITGKPQFWRRRPERTVWRRQQQKRRFVEKVDENDYRIVDDDNEGDSEPEELDAIRTGPDEPYILIIETLPKILFFRARNPIKKTVDESKEKEHFVDIEGQQYPIYQQHLPTIVLTLGNDGFLRRMSGDEIKDVFGEKLQVDYSKTSLKQLYSTVQDLRLGDSVESVEILLFNTTKKVSLKDALGPYGDMSIKDFFAMRVEAEQ